MISNRDRAAGPRFVFVPYAFLLNIKNHARAKPARLRAGFAIVETSERI